MSKMNSVCRAVRRLLLLLFAVQSHAVHGFVAAPSSSLLVVRPTSCSTAKKCWDSTSFLSVSRDENNDDSTKSSSSSSSVGDAPIPNLTISLIKSIVGAGVLSLPAGFAALGASSDIVPAAVATVLCSGALNAFYFRLVGVVCATTGAASYREAWERTVGTRTSSIIVLVVTLKTALSCLAFSIILADSAQALVNAAGWTDVSRTAALLGVTVVALVPLTLRRDLTSLAPFSAVGLLGVLITAITIIIRCKDGTYAVDTGTFVQDLPERFHPSFVDAATAATTSGADGWPGVVLVCTLATAFVAHYNAPRFYSELRDSSVERFQTVTFASYTVAAVLFVIVGCCGFLTFGQASNGYILNNYSPADPLANFSKTALTCSIVLTYPLPFVGLRDGCLDLLQVSDRNDQVHAVSTLTILAVITVGALMFRDLALVLSVGGGTFSTAVSAVFPVLMYLSLETDEKSTVEQVVAAAGMILSIGIGVTGVHLALAKAAAAAAAAT